MEEGEANIWIPKGHRAVDGRGGDPTLNADAIRKKKENSDGGCILQVCPSLVNSDTRTLAVAASWAGVGPT